jgi:hypothetical protein
MVNPDEVRKFDRNPSDQCVRVSVLAPYFVMVQKSLANYTALGRVYFIPCFKHFAIWQWRSLSNINIDSSVILCISIRVARLEKHRLISSTEIPELAIRVSSGWVIGVMTHRIDIIRHSLRSKQDKLYVTTSFVCPWLCYLVDPISE